MLCLRIKVRDMSKKNESKIIFSKEIDDKISGFAIAITFVVIGIGLSLSSNFFENEIVSEIIRWIFIVVGLLGMVAEYNKRKKKSSIKGFDDLAAGITCISIAGLILFLVKNIWGKVIFFLIALIGLYGCITALLKISYSVYISMKQRESNENNNKGVISDLIIFLTQLIGLLLIIIQFIQAFI